MRYRPFLVLLGMGVVVRIGLTLLYFPAVMLMFDSPRYARVDGMPMFGDFWMPAGYPMFLWLLRGASHQIWATIAAQHLVGLGTGILLYITMWRLGVKLWVACIPPAVAFLSGDHLYLEHMVMADFLLTFLCAAGLCAAVFGFTWGGSWRWFAVAGVCLGAASLVRSVGIVLLPILVVSLALWPCGSWRRQICASAAALLGGVAVSGLYYTAFKLSGDQYLGLSDMRGWNLYSRVAPFADCRKFSPPEGTAVLCEARKPTKRPGPFGYVWDLESVPRKTFPLGPETGKQLEAFAYAALMHQPKDYVGAVMSDLSRYIDPSLAPQRAYGGQPREIFSFGWRDKEVEDLVVEAMARSYRGTAVTVKAPRALATYQNFVRVHGLLLAISLVSALAGFWRGRDRMRQGIWLFGASALGLYLLPVATVSYDFRYGIPPATFLIASGVLGAAACCPRIKLEARLTGCGSRCP